MNTHKKTHTCTNIVNQNNHLMRKIDCFCKMFTLFPDLDICLTQFEIIGSYHTVFLSCDYFEGIDFFIILRALRFLGTITDPRQTTIRHDKP